MKLHADPGNVPYRRRKPAVFWLVVRVVENDSCGNKINEAKRFDVETGLSPN